MKTESLREVKNNLSRVIDELAETGAVLITKNGKTRAALIPVDDETDVETIVLSQNRRFWTLFEKSLRSADRKELTPLASLRD